MNYPDQILVIDDYLISEDCEHACDLFESTPVVNKQKDGWYGRVKWPKYSQDLENKLNFRRTKICQEHFGFKFKIINLNMTFWTEGHEMIPHSDYGGRAEYMNREFASIIYLNDDYDGGELYIPELNFEIKPKKGQLLCFRGGKMLHGVRKVTRGQRLTSICWFEVV
jgi:predicted 2-oxoglutarate/Fe(II)-dependent dioxygenase YbiX